MDSPSRYRIARISARQLSAALCMGSVVTDDISTVVDPTSPTNTIRFRAMVGTRTLLT